MDKPIQGVVVSWAMFSFSAMLVFGFTVLLAYVFPRASSVPFVARHASRRLLFGSAAVLWVLFLAGRIVGSRPGFVPWVIDFAAMNAMGVMFLLFVSLLFVDIVTLFGSYAPRFASRLRGAALVAGALLSVIALVQGMRPPAIVRYEVKVPGLPRALDGTKVAAMSDMHLGASPFTKRWLEGRVAQLAGEKPDLVALVGDIFEGHGPVDEGLIAALKGIHAPLGIWFVPGNHEFHSGDQMGLFERETAFRLLRNRWAEARPGLVIAGVDDLTNELRNGHNGAHNLTQALSRRPAGAAILLSHTPWEAERAARSGVGLMLSGHTHGGQIWPFGYAVRLPYPYFLGRYDVNGMTLLVCRGTGTWGPRMRLWKRGEILMVTLRAPA